jgi:hypothetical protein
MNKHLKEFFHRGMMFGGYGPIILGIIYLVLQKSIENFSLNGWQVFVAIISTYFLAFIQAGASVLNQIDTRFPLLMTGAHLSVLYFSTLGAYLINSWIPFRSDALGIFTAVFVIGYAVVWITVCIAIKTVSKKLNRKLN